MQPLVAYELSAFIFMHRSNILKISLLFSCCILTACSVDWNNEREAEIASIKTRISHLEEDVKKCQEQNQTNQDALNFEKQKYEEEMWYIENERLDKYRNSCAKEREKADSIYANLVNDTCSNRADFISCEKDLSERFGVSDDFFNNCMQKKLQWEWKGEY